MIYKKVDIKGMITFSLREYLKDQKDFMPCDTTSIIEKSSIFIQFLNSHDVILEYVDGGIHTHPCDGQLHDKNLYLSFKTQLCIAIAQRKKEFDLPHRNDMCVTHMSNEITNCLNLSMRNVIG